MVEEIQKRGYKAAIYDWNQVEITDSGFLYQGSDMLLPKAAMLNSRIRTRHVVGEKLFLFDWLELLERKGVRILNSTQAIRNSSNKVYAANLLKSSGIRVADTRLVSSVEQIEAALLEWKDIIIKPIDGNGSLGMERLILDENRFGDELTNVLSAFQEADVWTLMKHYKVLCAQKYISNPGRDIRINVVNGQVVSICAKNALPNTWRTKDINGGMRMEKFPLTEELEHIALSAVECLGLDYAPIDIVEGPKGPTIIEVNSAIAIWPGHETMGITIDPEGSVKHYVQMIVDNIEKSKINVII
ncbi:MULTISPECIES: ATP-grasp domain-containing protein [Bacillus cereus group]|uniref:ATP-grasp domain-containing protein n=1 Tax=Bacillus cereus group TaxID=86661 RepID=UPI0015FEDAAA|nr:MULTISPECIES: ATP-grasp domain-containing protein [Bacillus cereus group]MDF9530202.1 ATP-grasp domain-containing protein [Bacillus cereus]MDG1578391.1 ATP-grasp domain-containing protein [Bacillus cereus]